MSGGVSVLCWLAAPVAMFYGNLQNLVIKSKSVIKSISVISSQIDLCFASIYFPACYFSAAEDIKSTFHKKDR